MDWETKGKKLVQFACVILVASAAVAVWGASYQQSHTMDGAEVADKNGPLLAVLAGWALKLGVLAYVAGASLLIIGILLEPDKDDQER